jgi:hypothetical protein
MSTTYTKIRAVLAEMAGKPSWTPQQIKADLIVRDRKRDESNFHVRQRASKRKRALSDDAFDRLFALMIELELIKRDEGENFQIPQVVRTQLAEEGRYKIFLSRKVTALLDQADATIADIKQAAEAINYPSVRDPETILEELKQKGKAEKMALGRFKQILFLLAGAEQSAERHMRIFYDFK